MMASTAWPPKDEREYLTHYIDRLDGPVKCTGHARYTYDQNLQDMLYAKLHTATYGHARIRGIDTSKAEAMQGVEKVMLLVEEGAEVTYAGEPLVAVAAQTEEIAQEAMRSIQVDYEVLEAQMDDQDASLASGRPSEEASGDVEQAFQDAEVVSENRYGLAAITHCCLESHGQVSQFKDGELYVWGSTQNVSGYAGALTEPSGLEETQIHVDCQYMGGGFGSKFGADDWGKWCVTLAKETGKPVKLMLDRDVELMGAGARPSAFATVKVAADSSGKVTAIQSDTLGSAGDGGAGRLHAPDIFGNIPNRKTRFQRIDTNRGGSRAWRAPGHPQSCLITMAAMEDAAAALGMDAIEFFKKNLEYTDRPDVYAEQLDVAAEMIGYKQKAHLRPDETPGPLKRGLGISIHTWGGGGHASSSLCTVRPDGSVSIDCGTQDLGTGTRTVLAIVVAETLGIPLEKVQVNMGNNKYPQSGASGGSTTVGGVSSSSRDAATKALNKLLEKVASQLNVSADQLEAEDGQIREKGNPDNAVSWKRACSLLGQQAVTGQGERQMDLISSGVGGVQIADVTVDVETGVVTMNEFVAVQDCGLVVDMKTAESQVYGGMIMGITYALYEECAYDPATGRMLNPDMEFYRLAQLGDVGKLKVKMMTGPKYDERGVIGLGEPPVVSPGAAISNAVANATGVRVSEIPLTPDRVLMALAEGGVQA